MDWDILGFVLVALVPAALFGWNTAKILRFALFEPTHERRLSNCLLLFLLPMVGIYVWGARFGFFLLSSLSERSFDRCIFGLASVGAVLLIAFLLQYLFVGRHMGSRYVTGK